METAKLFHCPSCKKCFTTKDVNRSQQHTHFPYILNCGHTVCEACIRNAYKCKQKISCLHCQAETDLSEDYIQTLVPDIYALGILCNSVRQKPNVKLKFIPVGATKDVRNGNHSGVICDECSKTKAVWRCDKCAVNFCNFCFDLIHRKSKVMQKHESHPIQAEEYHSMVQGGCSEHLQRQIEFYCETDKELVCSYCVVMGKHKGHDVVTLMDKNESYIDQLKIAMEEAHKFQRIFKFTEKKFCEIIPSSKVEVSHLVNEIKKHFHKVHSVLQLREFQLLSELQSLANHNASNLESMCDELSHYRKELTAALKDAEELLSNRYISVSAIELVKKLEAFKEIPCYLVSVPSEENPDIKIKFDQASIENLKSYGNVEANIKLKYVLKSEKDLPSDYQIDLEEDTTTDTESLASCSVHSDSQSDDLSSPVSTTDLSKQKNAFLKANMSTIHEEEVFVSHICHPNNFWIQKLLDKRKLESMQETMNKWCNISNNVKASAKSAQMGSLYLVQYNADAKWYRARLKAVISHIDDEKKSSKINSLLTQCSENEDLVEIHYVDYGNTEIVPVSRLKNLPPRFLHQPSFAINCSLWDIMPITKDTWSQEAIKVFAKFVGNKTVLMKVMEQRNDLLYIDLCQPPANDIINDVPVSVRDALVFMDLACLLNENHRKKSSKYNTKRKYLPAEEFCHDVVVNVVLSHVSSPDLFYVQKLGGGARYLSNLQFKLQDRYKNESDYLHSVYTPTVGMVCVSQYSLDKQWYRAEVIGVQNSNMVEVQYVDFGNNEFVPYWRLRKIPDVFLKLNKQAICCCLADIAPVSAEGWDEKVNQWFTEVAGKKQLHIRTKSIVPGEKKASVVLYQVTGNVDICINALMVKEGLALSTGPESTVLEVPHETYLKTKNPPKVIFQPQKVSVPDKQSENSVSVNSANNTYSNVSHSQKVQNKKLPYLPVQVVHVESPSSLFVHLATDEEQKKFEKMMKDMQQTYQQTELSGVLWKKMDICAALASHDSHWLRGRIIKEIDSEHFQVVMLDFGFSEVVHQNDLRVLLDPFQEERIFSIRCKLTGIVPAGADNQWSFMACEFLQELVSKHEVFFFAKKGESEDDLQLVDLLYEEVQGGALEPTTLEYKSVVQLLIDKGLALPSRRLSQEKNLNVNKEDLSTSGSTTEDSCNNSTEKNSANKEKKETVSLPASIKDSCRMKTSTLRKSVLYWKPPTLPEDKNFIGIPTHVGHDCCIYVTLSSSSQILTLINDALQAMYSSPDMKPPDISPGVGQACIAQFYVDNKWYRAQVIAKNADQIQVLFIDYGNLETVQLDKIRTDLTLIEVPQQCLECELFDLLPAAKDGEWPTPVLDFIHTTIVEQVCYFRVEEPPHPGKRLQVTLILPDEMNLSTLLIERGDAISPSMLCNNNTIDTLEDINSEILDEKALNNSSESSSVASVLSVPKEDSTNPLQCFAEPTLPKASIQFPLIITQLLEPNMVYIQQPLVTDASTPEAAGRNEECQQFIAMMEELAENAAAFDVVKDPKPGMACCGMYSYDGKWYRCKIKALEGNDAAVFYVDYGNSETISTDNLRCLPDKFLKFPVQTFLCKLHGIVPNGDEWSDEEASKVVDELLQKNYSFLGKIKKYGVPVELDLFIDSTVSEDGKHHHIADLLKEQNILCKNE